MMKNQKFSEEKILEFKLSDLDRLPLAILFEMPEHGRFWVGPGKKVQGKTEPYFTTDEVRDWWAAGADPGVLLMCLPAKRRFPGMVCQFKEGASAPSGPPLPALEPASRVPSGDYVEGVLGGLDGLKIE